MKNERSLFQVFSKVCLGILVFCFQGSFDFYTFLGNLKGFLGNPNVLF